MGGLPPAGRSVAPSLCPRCGRPLPVTPLLFWPGRGVRVGCSPSPGPSSGRCGEQGWPRKKPAEEEKEEGSWPCRVSCGETCGDALSCFRGGVSWPGLGSVCVSECPCALTGAASSSECSSLSSKNCAGRLLRCAVPCFAGLASASALQTVPVVVPLL